MHGRRRTVLLYVVFIREKRRREEGERGRNCECEACLAHGNSNGSHRGKQEVGVECYAFCAGGGSLLMIVAGVQALREMGVWRHRVASHKRVRVWVRIMIKAP